MAKKEGKEKKRLRTCLVVVGAVLLLVIAGFLVYFNTGRYWAQDAARAALQSDDAVAVSVATSGDIDIVFQCRSESAQNGCGLVFYSGAKVEEDA